MKKNGKFYYVFIGVFIGLFILIILQFFFKKESNFLGEGNWMDNIRQYANIAENKKYIVFCNNISDTGLYYINKETMEQKKINYSDRISFLNIVNEIIYYNVGGDIHKYTIKTGKDIVISKKNSYNTIVVNDYIYTIKPDDNGHSKLYKMDLNGKRKKVIIENFNEFYIYKDIIYYSNIEDNYNLYSCDLNGLNTKKISDTSVAQISIHNDEIFYLDFNERILYKMDLRGENKFKLCNYKIQSINITDEKILFISDSKLYLANLNFTNVEILSEGVISNINVINNLILYRRPVNDKFGNEGIYIMDINKKVELEASLKNLYLIVN